MIIHCRFNKKINYQLKLKTMPKIVSIEGNIGAGKTTIINRLDNYLSNDKSVVLLREPVDIWEKIKDENGVTMLQKFYANPEKYGFAFQVMAFTTRLDMLKKCIANNPNCKVILCERSLDADYHVFAKMLYDAGTIDSVSYQVYLGMYGHFSKGYEADAIVYLDADASVCRERIVKRGRPGEENVALDYLLNCEGYHRDWLYPLNVLRLDCNFDETEEKVAEWLSKIKAFVSSENHPWDDMSYLKSSYA